MFLRHTKRKKDGKEHRYWSIVENRRIGGGRVVQRPLLYLGEINDSQELAWRKSIAILEEGALQPRTLSLFPEDRCEGLLPDASIVRLRLNELRLCRPRQWGGCWLALSLWRELELDRFWGGRLPPSRKGTRWDRVLLLLATYRLLAPGSEWRLHREWFERSAMADLLGEDLGLADIHKLYRWQHRGQHHLARLPGADRAPVRQGEAHLVDGPRHPDRGRAGRDAGVRSPGPIPRRHAQGPPDPIGEGPPREALAAGPAGCPGQALAARRRTLCFRRQRQPRRQGAGNAATTAEMVVGAPQAALNDGAQPRGIADEARRCPSPCPSRVAPGRHRGSA